jgi:hypothetical protein
MCRAETSFFVAPSEARGPSALTRLERTWMGCRPEPLFFCRAEAQAEGSPPCGCRPERSGGCLAIARHDKNGGSAGQIGRTK